jgi:hypothetical protein
MNKRKRGDNSSKSDIDMNIAKRFCAGSLSNAILKPNPVSHSTIRTRVAQALDNKIPKKMHLSVLIPFPPEHNFVSPSSLFHFIKQDPFQDVLNKFSWYFVKNFNNNDKLVHDASSQFIMDKGNEFESQVKDILINAMGFKIIEIPKRGDDIQDSVLYGLTVGAMEKGYDIIYQACVFNPELGIYGHPDFLIRSDKINDMGSTTQYPSEYINKSSRFGPYHYVVFDTKFRTLELNHDMSYMINRDSQRYYKVQLYIYTKCLEYIQGCLPAYGYIIGRGFRSKKTLNKVETITMSNNIFEKFGTVDMINIDAETTSPTQMTIPELVESGIEWIITLRSMNETTLNEVNWENPEYPYLRPNMNNKYTSNRDVCNMYNIKRDIAIAQGEPTLLANVKSQNRSLLHEKGIYSMYDERCTAESMSFKSGMSKDNIDLRLMQFRDKSGLIPDIYLRHIGNKRLNNQTISNRELMNKLVNQGYFVLDFETRISVADRFDDLPNSDADTYAYLIGLIDLYNSNKPIYLPFIADDLSDTAELFNFKQFINYMKPHYQSGDGPGILTWSKAENSFIKKLLNKYDDILSEEDKFIVDEILKSTIDMYEFFEKEHIIIRDCYTLKLKEVSKKLYNMGIIQTTWTDDMGGLAALSSIDRINDEATIADINLGEHPDFAPMLEYNRIDCQVIAEIVEWLSTKIRNYNNRIIQN